jgi:hypothetical protein
MKTVGILVPLNKEAAVLSQALGLASEKIVQGRHIYEGKLGDCPVVWETPNECVRTCVDDGP